MDQHTDAAAPASSLAFLALPPENGQFGESYSQVIQRILDEMETEAHLIRIIMMTDDLRFASFSKIAPFLTISLNWCCINRSLFAEVIVEVNT